MRIGIRLKIGNESWKERELTRWEWEEWECKNSFLVISNMQYCRPNRLSTKPHHSFSISESPLSTPTTSSSSIYLQLSSSVLPSVLWHCWLVIRKSIRPVKIWVMRCWCGYLSVARCRLFAYGSADATAIPKPNNLLASFKSKLVLLFWYRLTQVVPKKGRKTDVVSSSIADAERKSQWKSTKITTTSLLLGKIGERHGIQ